MTKAIVVLIILWINVFATSCQYTFENSLTKQNIRGKVHIITESTYSIVEINGEIQKDYLKFKSVSIYNADGNEIEENWYYSSGKLGHRHTIKYDKKGKIVEKIFLDSDSSLGSKTIYKYDTKGNLIEENFSDTTSNFIIKLKDTYLYDPSGYLIESKRYYNGILQSIDTYKYDTSGKMIEEKSSGPDNFFKHRITIEYDTMGNEIKRNWHVSEDGTILTFQYKYVEYDEIGNWLKRIDYNEETPTSIIEREIEYYP